jgi:hypothetical protein
VDHISEYTFLRSDTTCGSKEEALPLMTNFPLLKSSQVPSVVQIRRRQKLCRSNGRRILSKDVSMAEYSGFKSRQTQHTARLAGYVATNPGYCGGLRVACVYSLSN